MQVTTSAAMTPIPTHDTQMTGSTGKLSLESIFIVSPWGWVHSVLFRAWVSSATSYQHCTVLCMFFFIVATFLNLWSFSIIQWPSRIIVWLSSCSVKLEMVCQSNLWWIRKNRNKKVFSVHCSDLKDFTCPSKAISEKLFLFCFETEYYYVTLASLELTM